MSFIIFHDFSPWQPLFFVMPKTSCQRRLLLAPFLFFDGFLACRHNRIFQPHLKLPCPRLESAICPGSPGSFHWKVAFEVTVLALGMLLTSRTFQSTELENTQI